MAPRHTVDFASHPLLASLEKVPPPEIRRFRKEHPGIPEDYLAFLQTVGHGTIDSGYKVYGGPISPSFVLGPGSKVEVGALILFGDDFQGSCGGFDARWRVVEVDPRGEARVVAPTFTRFLSRWLAHRATLVEERSEAEDPPTKALTRKRPTSKWNARKSPKK